MTDTWRFDSLPSDVLLLIFDYCHAFDLVRLSEVCRRFNEIVRDDNLWIKKSKQALVTNQTSKKFRERCNPLLSLRKKWHVSNNWQYGKYEKRILFLQKAKLMPWLQLTSDTLWWSGGNEIAVYNRRNIIARPNKILMKYPKDVCKFVVRDNVIISSHRDGILEGRSITNEKSRNFSIRNAHNCDIIAVDVASQAIISGSRDGIVKIWPINLHNEASPLASIELSDRLWSLTANSLVQKCAVGLSGNSNVSPIHIFDIECHSESDVLKYPSRRGAGILDMVWDNPQTLLTCGYDTYIRKWDLRTGTCVNSWSDPTDATLYCISSDYHYTMITGTQYNCKAVLWDQRQARFVQLYFMDLNQISSPVYSLCFDSCHLYGATDRHMVELQFSGRSYKEHNYRELFRYDVPASNWNRISNSTNLRN